MAHIAQVDPGTAEGQLARIYDQAQQRAGGVANIIRVMSLDPRSLAGSMQFYVSLMKQDNALPAADRELLAAVVSNVNDCYY